VRKLTVRIKRYDPERDESPHWETYRAEADSTDRVLDVLLRVKWEQDDTLALRYSCAHGVCGSDAMRINGFNSLACKVLVKTLASDTLTIEPMLALPVIKDLIVDMKPFFDSYKSVMPFLVNDDPPPTTERLQSTAERARYDDTTKCILCAACTTACPPFWHGQRYVGPAAIVNAHRFIFDSRDRATAERLEIMNDVDGVWRCRKVFNCTGACPRGIQVTKAIIEVQLALLTGSTDERPAVPDT
jgi:succinate dehydrogenase / fumarate reductase iron-sulfur subunit